VTIRVLAAASALVTTLAVALPTSPKAGDEPPVPVAKLLGQRFVVRFAGTQPSRRLLQRIRAGEVGGVILFSDNVRSASAVRGLLARLDRVARAGGNPPLLAVVDQEGGTVKRFPSGPPSLSASELGALRDRRRAFREGAATGRYLRRLGIDVDLAPVLDVPSSSATFLGSRAYSGNRFVVADVGGAFARGLQAGGVAASAKHFPGIGTSLRNTDERPVAILRSQRELDRRLLPFRVAIRDGVELVMVSNASYPAYDRSGAPAVFSRQIVRGLLRETLGFRGLVISDDLEARALRRRGRAEAALRAGVDLVLFARSESGSTRAYAEALSAARAGRLDRAALQRSYDAILAFKRRESGGERAHAELLAAAAMSAVVGSQRELRRLDAGASRAQCVRLCRRDRSLLGPARECAEDGHSGWKDPHGAGREGRQRGGRYRRGWDDPPRDLARLLGRGLRHLGRLDRRGTRALGDLHAARAAHRRRVHAGVDEGEGARGRGANGAG
jgi:beta-N-acetylhexosaminidase